MSTGNTQAHDVKVRQLTALRYLLLHEGKSIKETAAILRVSTKTVSRLIRQYGLKEEIRQAKAEKLSDPVKYDESLTAFVLYVRVHDRQSYTAIERMYNQFLKTV